jgi:hypothetical protein
MKEDRFTCVRDKKHIWHFSLEDNIKMDLKERGVRVYTGFIFLRIGSSGELL